MIKHKILSETPVISTHAGNIIDLEVQHPLEDKKKTYTIACHPDWVNIVGETEEGNVILISQWRAGINEITLEVPGGKIDNGEDPLVAGIRELEEETGYTKTKDSIVVDLGFVYANPAIQNNKMHFFFINKLKKTKETKFDEMEFVRTKIVGKKEIHKLIENESILHAYSSLVLERAYLRHP